MPLWASKAIAVTNSLGRQEHSRAVGYRQHTNQGVLCSLQTAVKLSGYELSTSSILGGSGAELTWGCRVSACVCSHAAQTTQC